MKKVIVFLLTMSLFVSVFATENHERNSSENEPEPNLSTNKTYTLSGTIYGSDGGKVKKASIKLGSYNAQSDKNGEFRLQAIPPDDIQDNRYCFWI